MISLVQAASILLCSSQVAELTSSLTLKTAQVFLDVTFFGFDDFSRDILPFMRDIAGKAVIDFLSGERVVLSGVVQSNLDASDFIGINTPS